MGGLQAHSRNFELATIFWVPVLGDEFFGSGGRYRKDRQVFRKPWFGKSHWFEGRDATTILAVTCLILSNVTQGDSS